MDEKDLRRVAAESGLDVRTVRRVVAGERPRSAVTVEAIEGACRKLRINWKPKKKGKAA